MFLRPLLAQPNESADGSGSRIKDADLIFLDDFPEAIRLGPGGRSLVHQDGRSVLQRTVDHVAVPGDPANVGRAPESVFVAKIENPLAGDVGTHRVAAGGVQDAFRLAGCSR